MSFDPITGTWAANKAAEIVGQSGGGSPVYVNLCDFGFTEEVISSAENSAPVTVEMTIEQMDNFYKAVTADNVAGYVLRPAPDDILSVTARPVVTYVGTFDLSGTEEPIIGTVFLFFLSPSSALANLNFYQITPSDEANGYVVTHGYKFAGTINSKA